MLHEFSQSSALIEVTGNRSEEGGVLFSVTKACTGGKVAYLIKRKKRQNQVKVLQDSESGQFVS